MLVHPGDYPLTAAIEFTKAVTMRGTTGNPADVRVSCNVAGVEYFLTLNNAALFLADLTVQSGTKSPNKYLLYDGSFGGTVSNCVIRNYTSGNVWASAPVCLQRSNSLITHCVFTNNYATPTYAEYGGAGAVVLTGGARVENCLVVDCRANRDAGGITVNNGKAVNCTVVRCSAPVGGISCGTGGFVTNCLIACNSATDAANANVNTTGEGFANFSHCASETVAADGWVLGTTNTLFRDFAAGDYRPRRTSPIFHAGAYVPSVAGTVDLRGRPRKAPRPLDIGCYKIPDDGFVIIAR